MVTVSKDCAGRYLVVSAKSPTESMIGIELGLTYFAVTSAGSKFQSPKALHTKLQKLGLLYAIQAFT